VRRVVIYEPTEFRIAELAPISTHHVKTVTLRVGMDESHEQVVRSIGLDGKKLGEAPAAAVLREVDELVQPIRVDETNGHTELILKQTRNRTSGPVGPLVLQTSPVAIDKNGQRYESIRSEGREDSYSRFYNIRCDNIVRFEYRLRPYRHSVTFENVSLEPGQKTDVNVKVVSLPEAFEPFDCEIVDAVSGEPIPGNAGNQRVRESFSPWRGRGTPIRESVWR
jgi:hypothetical protein